MHVFIIPNEISRNIDFFLLTSWNLECESICCSWKMGLEISLYSTASTILLGRRHLSLITVSEKLVQFSLYSAVFQHETPICLDVFVIQLASNMWFCTLHAWLVNFTACEVRFFFSECRKCVPGTLRSIQVNSKPACCCPLTWNSSKYQLHAALLVMKSVANSFRCCLLRCC